MKKMSGFTLIELITAIGLGALILSGLGAVFSGTIRLWSSVQNSTSALKEARLAMEWITRDIREGTIVEIGDNFIKLAAMKYFLNGTNLMRDSDLVAQGVAGLGFKYYNKNGEEDDDLAKMIFVSIVLTVEEGGHSITLRNGANLRNFVPTE